MTHKIEVEKHSESRIILHVNGFSLDVIVDDDGIEATLIKDQDDIIQTTLGWDWNESP